MSSVGQLFLSPSISRCSRQDCGCAKGAVGEGEESNEVRSPTRPSTCHDLVAANKILIGFGLRHIAPLCLSPWVINRIITPCLRVRFEKQDKAGHSTGSKYQRCLRRDFNRNSRFNPDAACVSAHFSAPNLLFASFWASDRPHVNYYMINSVGAADRNRRPRLRSADVNGCVQQQCVF